MTALATVCFPCLKSFSVFIYRVSLFFSPFMSSRFHLTLFTVVERRLLFYKNCNSFLLLLLLFYVCCGENCLTFSVSRNLCLFFSSLFFFYFCRPRFFANRTPPQRKGCERKKEEMCKRVNMISNPPASVAHNCNNCMSP